MSWRFVLKEVGNWWRILSWAVAQSRPHVGRIVILGPWKESGCGGVLPDKMGLTLQLTSDGIGEHPPTLPEGLQGVP